MDALLIRDTARGTQQRIALNREALTIGSADGNDLILRLDGIEPRHCRIERLGDEFKVVDLHTDHGTRVNGAFVAQKRLDVGDRIQLGTVEIVYERVAGKAAAPPRAAPPPAAVAPPARGPVTSAKPAPVAVASEAEPSRPERRRRDGGTGRMVRTALYTAAAVILVAGLSSVLPDLVATADGGSVVKDRLALVDVWRQAGHYDKALVVLNDLRHGGYDVAPSTLDGARRRIEQDRIRRDQARAELAELRENESRSPVEKLRRAKDLLESYEDIPAVREPFALELYRAMNHAQLEEDVRTASLGELYQMADTFLASQNFAGARGVWASLSESPLFVDQMLCESAREAIETAAEAEADRLLARVEERIAARDVLGASIVLAESEVATFRGTAAYDRLDRRADQIELALNTQGPHDLVRPPIDVAPLEERPRNEGRPRPEKPSLPKVDPARSDDVQKATATGDALFSGGDLAGARAAYNAALSSGLGFAERARLTRRIERANRAGWFLDSLKNYVEADPGLARRVTVALKDGASGVIDGVEGDAFIVEVGGERREIQPNELAAPSVAAVAKSYRLTKEDLLNFAFFSMVAGDAKQIDDLLLRASEDPSLKQPIDSAIAFVREIPEVPEWGFFRHEGQWLSFRERERAMNLKAVDVAVAKLAKADEATYANGLEELRSLMPVAKEDIVVHLQKRRVALLDELRAQPELQSLDRLNQEKRELDERREAALELIFDSVKYFYPYEAPAVPPDKATLYPKVQQEVDALVERVRDAWGKEMEEASGGVTLSKKFNRLLFTIREEQALLVLADPDGFREEPDLQTVKLLPKDAKKLTIRNVALSIEERQRLDRDVEVLAANAQAKNAALPQELEQVHVTNMYRLMMGRQAVRVDERLVRAARGHCEWMSRSGKFSHFNDEDPNLRTPGQRIQAQGFTAGGAGENIAINGSASGAHYAWLHSSGHHRNILFASHTHLGAGNMGRYWCQNFAGGAEYSGNLGDDF